MPVKLLPLCILASKGSATKYNLRLPNISCQYGEKGGLAKWFEWLSAIIEMKIA